MKKLILTSFLLFSLFAFSASRAVAQDYTGYQQQCDNQLINTSNKAGVIDYLKKNDNSNFLIGCYFKKRGTNGTQTIAGNWSISYCAQQYCANYRNWCQDYTDYCIDPPSKTDSVNFSKGTCGQLGNFCVMGDIISNRSYTGGGGDKCVDIVKNNIAKIMLDNENIGPIEYVLGAYKENSGVSAGDIFGQCFYRDYIQGTYLKVGKNITGLAGNAPPACCVAYPKGSSVPESCSAMRKPCANNSNGYEIKEFSDQNDATKNAACATLSSDFNKSFGTKLGPVVIDNVSYNGEGDKDIGALCAVKSQIKDANTKKTVDEWCTKLSETCCQFMSNACTGKYAVDSAGFANNVFIQAGPGFHDTNIPDRPTVIYMRPTVGIPGTDFSTGKLVAIDASTFGKFLGQFFGFALSIVAIMAILMIILAGAKMYYYAAKGNINEAAKAKDQIKGAILGLVFTLAAVTIFRFISPRLVEIPSLTTQNIAVNTKDKFDYQAVFGSSYGGGTNGDVSSIALKEFERWGNGTVKESDNKDNSELPGYAYIKKYYYPAGKCADLDPTTTGGAWSSAFISFVMKTAGINTFPASCMHTGYFKKIKDVPGACVANRMTEVDKIGVGNILCKNRSGNTSVTFDNPSGEAHCDIVTSRSGDSIDIVGGNRDIKGDGSTDGLTVAKSTVKISNIKNNAGYFGFIACSGSHSTNNGGNQSGSQCSNNFISDSSGSSIASSGDASYLNGLNYKTSPWPINVVKAQSIQESKWGTSPVAKNNKNYFGMICGSWKTDHPDKCGSNGYRRYGSIQESLDDYYNTLNGNTWKTALANTKMQLAKNSVFIDYSNVCQAAWFGFKHKTVSYAMDSNYSSKIVAILNSQFSANCPNDRSEYFKDSTGTVNLTAMANYSSCQL